LFDSWPSIAFPAQFPRDKTLGFQDFSSEWELPTLLTSWCGLPPKFSPKPFRCRQGKHRPRQAKEQIERIASGEYPGEVILDGYTKQKYMA
jgi:hypothetical protein